MIVVFVAGATTFKALYIRIKSCRTIVARNSNSLEHNRTIQGKVSTGRSASVLLDL